MYSLSEKCNVKGESGNQLNMPIIIGLSCRFSITLIENVYKGVEERNGTKLFIEKKRRLVAN
jgi:hypothetical protein